MDDMSDDDKERFYLSYVLYDGCWLWIRGQCTGGYGQIVINGKARRAHRVAYEMAYGVALTPDQFLHHVCRNKLCVNPDHMEITNQADHVDSATFGNKEKTHCPHGHEYTPENICWNRGGKSRECRTCKYQRVRRRYWRKVADTQERLKQLALKCQAK